MDKPYRQKTILVFFATILVITFVSFLFEKIKQKQSTNNQNQNIFTPTEKPQNTPTSTLSSSDYQTYKFKINLLTESEFDFSDFVSLFKQQLNIPKTTNVYTEDLKIYNIPTEKYSNIIKSDYSFNKKEFIALIRKNIDVKDIYQNELYKITLERNDSINMEYLLNKFFCQQNSDCQIINYECSYGAYNQYQQIRLPFGCESGTFDYQNNYYFGTYDQVMKCSSQVKYQTAKCINNKCIGQNRTVKCAGGLEPTLAD